MGKKPSKKVKVKDRPPPEVDAEEVIDAPEQVEMSPNNFATAAVGDYILTFPSGGKSIMPPDIFAATYEDV